MIFQKLTYSENTSNNYLYFSLKGDFLHVDELTSKLGIQPTSVQMKSHPVPKLTSWKYQIDLGNEIDFETPLETLIDLLEPKTKTIIQLKQSFGLTSKLQLVIDIDFNPKVSTPYFGLNKKIISFLSATETEIDFDLYKVDTFGLDTE